MLFLFYFTAACLSPVKKVAKLERTTSEGGCSNYMLTSFCFVHCTLLTLHSMEKGQKRGCQETRKLLLLPVGFVVTV